MRPRMVIFLLFCYASVTSGQGEKVAFTSRNFINILTWEPAEPRFPGEKVQYSVLYSASDKEKEVFQIKAECQNITELSCDLTDETPAVYDVHYRAKVLVGDSDYGQTRRFRPVAETVLGAPILSHNISRASLHVNVKLPLGRNNESISDIFKKNIKGPSGDFAVYHLIITKPLKATQEIENTSGHFVVNLKDDQMQYCGYVEYKPAVEWGRPRSEKASFCTTQPGPFWMPWIILSVAVLVAVLLVAVCCVKRYVTHVKKTWPQSLGFKEQSSDSHEAIMKPEEAHNISKLEISVCLSEKIEYANIHMMPPVLSVRDGHSNKILSWTENSFDRGVGVHGRVLRYPDTSTESSVNYGGVVVEENGDFHQLQTDQAWKNAQWISSKEGLVESGPSPKTIPLSNVNIYENGETQPLLLQTQRDSEGQLMLSLQAPFSGTTDTLVSLQRKPLLSYLTVSSDKGSNFVSLHSLDSSDCSDFGSDENTLPTPTQDYGNSHYLPTQPDFTHFSPDSQSSLSCDSGTYDTPYKQNWMPSISNGTSTTNYAWTWSGLKEESKEAD
ncbi:interferon lambda receptor 1 [Periophthalmus magnuspinnatus]|uniref:interferon lambda receptor 1 n=1 Tax=Periophthalmus magnuspinnatus TaxID=409849 RepID=UPI00145A6C57|nr:interferon lambda receptor 1 [Periophthalmus magnuspinnatus]